MDFGELWSRLGVFQRLGLATIGAVLVVLVIIWIIG